MAAWESAPIEGAAKGKPAWMNAPVEGVQAAEDPFPVKLGRVVRDAAAGAVRGAGSIGATLLAPIDMAGDALAGKGLSLESNRQRRSDMTEALKSMGADTESTAFAGAKIGVEVAGTLGAGGVLANGLSRIAPQAVKAIQALRTAGMSAGPVAPGVAGFASNAITRAAGGAAVGGGSSALVDPESGGAGALIGGALPGVMQGIGKVAQGVGAVWRSAQRSGPAPASVGDLAKALGIPEQDAARMVATAQQASDFVPGSELTFSQALQKQGAKDPGVTLLERIVAGGPGGDPLLKRYEAQNAARVAALKAEGAQTYQGAAKEESERAGNKIGAVLRTQAADAREVDRAAWEGLHARAARDGVALHLPVDEMTAAMKPLGPGRVGAGKDARAVMSEATNIGTVEVPAVGASPVDRNAKTLAQAVRKAGGLSLNEGFDEGLRGELMGLKGDLKNLVQKKGGLSVARMAEAMHEAGYIADEGGDTLIQALREDAVRRPQFSIGSDFGSIYGKARDQAMGDLPGAKRVPIPVPFDQFQRLRSSSRELGAAPNVKPSEAVVLNDFERLLSGRADDAAAGNLRSGEVMPPEFMGAYNTARSSTRDFHDKYGQTNNIGAILRKPIGQDYALTGDEITNKLWHGGSGLAGDVSNLKNVLAPDNFDPAMNALRGSIMTEAASKTTASGAFGAALPKYVESRFSGLVEAMTPSQMQALSSVAGDIRNAEAAAAVLGLRGSDTQAKIARALDAGLIDSAIAKSLGRVLTIKGLGVEPLRKKLADIVAENKAAAFAELLANKQAGAAIPRAENSGNAIAQAVLRAAPVAISSR